MQTEPITFQVCSEAAHAFKSASETERNIWNYCLDPIRELI